MIKNMSSVDRIVRLILAAAMIALVFTNTVTGVLAIALLVVAGVFVLTSLVSSCPIYSLFGISTCSFKHKTGAVT